MLDQSLILFADVKKSLNNLKKHLDTDGKYPYMQEMRFRHKDGHIVWVICRGVAIKNDRGNFTRVVGTYTDITSLKQAETKEILELKRLHM